MPGSNGGAEAAHTNALRVRVRTARESVNLTQQQMATALGVSLDAYRKYELRSPLPPHLFEPFSIITHVDIYWLVTGKKPSSRTQLKVIRAS